MSPTHTRKGQKLYRYYVSQSVIRGTDTSGGAVSDSIQGDNAGSRAPSPLRRVPAAEIERAVIDQLRILLCSPEVIVATWRAARQDIEGLSESDVREALGRFDSLWDELFPAEQARIIQLLVERVQVHEAGVDISLRAGGLTGLVADLRAKPDQKAA
jgi:hypothetical protein